MIWSSALVTIAAAATLSVSNVHAASKPNIVIILADDLGYGDIHALNPERGRIPTPRLDGLARESMTFTDAHGSSAVCTPTRYGLLTGRYNWRSKLQKSVLPPYAPPLIAPGRLTLPEMLGKKGYVTACFGKWHLGWNWPDGKDRADFTKPLGGGPTALGFDHFFGVDVPNYPPYCFIQDDHTVGIPSVPLPEASVGRVLASTSGMSIPGWKLEEVLPTITDKTCEFIRTRSKDSKPFFVYFSLTSPHTPLVPLPEWKGKSGLGDYADWVMQTDAMVGKVLDSLREAGAEQDTIVAFTSDNGFAPYAGAESLEAKGHFPSGDRRGYKSDAWDGGHRVPLMIRWPGKVAAASHCGQMVCLNDFMATFADIDGATLPEDAAEDSMSLLPLLHGRDQAVRDTLVHHSINGNFAIREGMWKLILCPGSGGWSGGPESPAVQLYDLSQDAAEKTNLEAKHPEIVRRLTAKLEKIVADGRSTPGPEQKNDVEVDLYKLKRPKSGG
jgi:arylsulfatase A-like enzyme